MNTYMKCNIKKSLLDALYYINNNEKGMVFIVDDEQKLKGVLTDGDIRRLLISGEDLSNRIEKYMPSKCVYAYDNESYEEIRHKCTEDIKIVPIVNDQLEIIDYFEYTIVTHIPVAHPQLNGNEMLYLLDALSSTWISSNGEYVRSLERNFSNYCNAQYGVATSNGTTALHLALVALGISEGDEVIVPNLTFAATINSVIYTGATPVIVDIEEESWCIDPEEIERAITPRTKAIIPVHLYGQPCNMEKICSIAKKNDLYVVEDCAEAHGAEFDGKKVGTFGDVGCFSFFGNKIITTGEGGMCVTNSEELNEKMMQLRDHGMSKSKKYFHDVIGFNYRMTNMQAAVGVAQLEHIGEKLTWREKLEDEYFKSFKGSSNIVCQKKNIVNRKKVAWLVSILVNENKRDLLIGKMKEKGIDARPFFVPLSEMDIYKSYVFSEKISKKVSQQGINLPTNYDMTIENVQMITTLVKQILKE